MPLTTLTTFVFCIKTHLQTPMISYGKLKVIIKFIKYENGFHHSLTTLTSPNKLHITIESAYTIQYTYFDAVNEQVDKKNPHIIFLSFLSDLLLHEELCMHQIYTKQT